MTDRETLNIRLGNELDALLGVINETDPETDKYGILVKNFSILYEKYQADGQQEDRKAAEEQELELKRQEQENRFSLEQEELELKRKAQEEDAIEEMARLTEDHRRDIRNQVFGLARTAGGMSFMAFIIAGLLRYERDNGIFSQSGKIVLGKVLGELTEFFKW